MIIKEKQIQNKEYNFDLCIIGSGHSALPIALNLVNSNINICIIPGGSNRISNILQSTYDGKTNIKNNSLQKHRLRVIGGTSKIWGGRCLPLKDIDFKTRGYVKNSGWPIKKEELEKYYKKTASFLDIGDPDFDCMSLKSKFTYLIEGFNNQNVTTNEIEKFSLPTDFSKKFKKKLIASNDITIFDNSSLIEIEYNKKNNSVNKFYCKSLNGNNFTITATNYVLAAGGIENARILLHRFNFSRKYTCGNKYNNVGKYFMSHFSGIIGKIIFEKNIKVNNSYEFCKKNVYSRRRISISNNAQLKNKILNFSAFLHHSPIEDPTHKDGLLSLIFILKNLRYFSHRIPPEYSKSLSSARFDLKYYFPHIKNIFIDLYKLIPTLLYIFKKRFIDRRKLPSIITGISNNELFIHYHVEHEPLKSNYIKLSDDYDIFGLKKVYVHLSPSKKDIQSIITSHKIIDKELKKQKKGKLLFIYKDQIQAIKNQIGFGGHLIGTTRMSNNYMTGVVDKNCKIHGMNNFYVAGSSVFPTGGEANPVFTIIALSLRLSEHLREKYRNE